MAIEAALDNIVKDGTGYVAYVQFILDGKIIDTMDVRYDPIDEKVFKDRVGQRILSLENTLTAIKEKAVATLAAVVTEKATEIAAMKAQQENVEVL